MSRNCTFPNCGHEHYALGLCLGHYRQQRSGKELTAIKRRQKHAGCTFPGCTRPPRAKGLCGAHWMQQRRGRPLSPIEEQPEGKACTFEGCEKPRLSRGWCAGHYNQWFTGRPLSALRRVDSARGCAVGGCAAKHYARSLCKNHVRQAVAYKMTVEELVIALDAGACPICHRAWGESKGRQPHIDHDHESGIVRGVLCGECNMGIGKLRDDPKRLDSAAEYIRRANEAELSEPLEDEDQEGVEDDDPEDPPTAA